MENNLTPKNIVDELDKYIISQDDAKKSVAISLRNRYRRKLIKNEELRKEITPKNILLVGATGTGKTEIARRLAEIVKAPFIKIEATKYTEIGYVGRNVESIIKDLTNNAYLKILNETLIENKKEALPIIIKKIAKIYKNQTEKLKDILLEDIIENIKDGKFDNKKIVVEPKKNRGKRNVLLSKLLLNMRENNDTGEIREVLDDAEEMALQGSNKRKMKISEAIDVLSEELAKEILEKKNIEKIVIDKVQEEGIVFIDEIDKIIEKGGNYTGEVSRQGVQRDILSIIEGCVVETKYGNVSTEHILFIAAGSFTDSSPSDIMPELQGRFPVTVKLKNLKKEDYIKILTKVKYNILVQYKEMLLSDDVELEFTESGIVKIAEITDELNNNIENLGVRRLHSVIEEILKNVMYEAPYKEKTKIIVDRKFILEIFKEEFEVEDLNKYII